MDLRVEFSNRIRMLRKQYGYTPKEFAKMLNIKLQTYYTYERNVLPSYEALIHIAKCCDISLDWLCGMSTIQSRTQEKSDVANILEKLLTANENGQIIEVQILQSVPVHHVQSADEV